HGVRTRGFGDGEQLVPADELHAGTPELLAEGALDLVDPGPAGIQDRAGSPLGEQALDRLGSRVVAVADVSLAEVREQVRDRLRRVLLVRADDPRRPALDPAGAVHTACSVVEEHASA